MTTDRTRRRALTRGVAVVAAGWGAALVSRPAAVIRAVGGDEAPPSWVVRVLGARLLLQQTAVLIRPTRGPVVAGAALDALHALSTVAVVLRWPAYRRMAVVSGGTSVAGAVLSVLAAPPAGR